MQSEPLKVQATHDPSQPLISEGKFNFAKVDHLKQNFEDELLRVMLTKVKKQKEGQIVVEDTGSALLDVKLNHFIEVNDSKFKTITMPSKDTEKDIKKQLMETGENGELSFARTIHEEEDEAYEVDGVDGLQMDGMLLKPKKKKEYRYSQQLNVIPETMTPRSSRLGASTRSFQSSVV